MMVLRLAFVAFVAHIAWRTVRGVHRALEDDLPSEGSFDRGEAWIIAVVIAALILFAAMAAIGGTIAAVLWVLS